MRKGMSIGRILGIALAFVLIASAICWLSFTPSHVAAQAGTDYSYTTVDFPGADYTGFRAVNNLGEIVGRRSQIGEPFPEGSFLLRGTDFTMIEVPGAHQTHAQGINDAGEIVGWYNSDSDGEQGFLFSAGIFTTITVPGIERVYPMDINNSGDIVGFYYTYENGVVARGFLLSGTDFTTIDVPGADATYANGINNLGQIVGYYLADGFHAFSLHEGIITTLPVPNGFALGINDAGQIVGGRFFGTGFLFDGNGVTTIHVPISYATSPYGINNLGQIVGQCATGDPGYPSYGEHGFLATPATTEVGHVILIEPLYISPGIPYFVGDILAAAFTVENRGNTAITLDKLLLGGRYSGGELPGGGFPDFSHQTVTLQPGQTHEYEGTLTIQEPGIYRFFIAYYIENPTEAEKQFLDENNWNTSITLDEGLDDSHRTRGLVAWPKFKPPYGSGIKDSSGDVLGVPGTAHSDHDAIVCSVAGTGGVQANAIALGGSIAWADAYFAIGDTWRSSLSGEYRVVAPFSVSGIVSLAEIRTFIFGDCVGSIAFKASLHVYDETAGMLVLQQEEIIFEEKIEWWDYIPFQPPRAVTKAYPGEPYVVQGLLNLEKDHDYTWTFRVSVGVEVRAVLLGYAQANSRLEISLDHVRIEPPLSWIAPPEASPKAMNIKYVAVASPVGLLIVDGEGRSTGFDFDSQQIVNEIPDAWYIGRDATVQLVGIPRPVIGSYRVKVSGIDDGTYGLTTLLFTDDESGIFNGTGIPTSGGVIHQYTFDWDALARGEDGVTVSVDSDGDGVFERTFVAGSELTGDQFILHTETFIDFDPNVLNLRARGGLVTVYIELPEGFDVNDIDVSTILLNGTVPALEWPYEVGDYNDNGIPDLMVKFDRRAVHEVVEVGESVEIAITGEVDGIPFMAVDTIRVIGQ